MQTLVTDGLYARNLSTLLALAKERFDQSPALYGTLIYIFESLDHEQGLPLARYDQIVQHLTQPLLDALDAESGPPIDLLAKLNRLHEEFFKL
jgi:hypothetical protein